MVLLSPLGCQDPVRPAQLADPSARPPEPGSFIDEEEPLSPSQISSCGAATVTLDFVRPNLYFAIDASGSMTDGIPLGAGTYTAGTAPGNRYIALSRAIQSLLARIGHRVNYGATLFPTSQGSGCDGGEEIRELGPADDVSFAVSGQLGPELRSFMFNIERRAPSGGTPVARALSGILPRLSGDAADTHVLLVTDGGPNCNDASNCGPDTCIPKLERQFITDRILCDDSVNCCSAELYGPSNCLDTAGSLEAVQRLSAAGIGTFVIGIPGSEAYSSVLDQLALAGGAARPDEPHYYRVEDAEELLSTVGALGTTVALSCSIELREPPPDPDLVNLFFDAELVVADAVDGWTFTGDRTVSVHGAACDLLQGGQVLQADVVAGCPIVLK